MVNYMPIALFNENTFYNSTYFICTLHLSKTHLIIFFIFNSTLLLYERNLQLTHESQEIEIMTTIPKPEKK